MVARDGVEPPTPAFSGSRPKLSADSARHSAEFLSDFVLIIGAKMEPSRKNLSLPRFASIRHGFEVPAHLNRNPSGLVRQPIAGRFALGVKAGWLNVTLTNSPANQRPELADTPSSCIALAILYKLLIINLNPFASITSDNVPRNGQ